MALRRIERELPTASLFERWDPFRMMREFLGYEPFRELMPEARVFSPRFEVLERRDSYVFKGDLPGVKESDLDIGLTGNRLIISGKREEEARHEGETYYAYERSYGDFQRSFTLPEGVDAENIQAELREGVLTVMVPKKPELKAKKIEIK
ncbi:MAG: Hsp20/alpha crystallin family protein, partial [Deltaproteobacteria bacterium]|nr:Hsp20/alpha crystallin family protein [Deltaproteobacteria bacterium]